MNALIAAVFIAVSGISGLILGANMGAETACESVKMEWVKDKCMKVTREEVK